LRVVPVRGNVDTRLRKLEAGEADGMVIAAAGLNRLGRGDFIGEFLADDICLSAAAQGALALEAREQTAASGEYTFLHDSITYAEVTAERSFLQRLGGGCHVPVGARARVQAGKLNIKGVVASPDGSALYRGEILSDIASGAASGRELAERLLRDGAETILFAH
jgi:hydroxymethylbilane synthase